MYLDNSEHKAKIGLVSIDVKNNQIRIRFTYPKGKRNDFYVGKPTDNNWQAALKTAQIINRDIDIGDYDPTLVRYKPKRAKALEIAQKKPNLIDLWDSYKHSSGELSETYTTYELSIALGLFKTEFFAVLDNYYTLRDE